MISALPQAAVPSEIADEQSNLIFNAMCDGNLAAMIKEGSITAVALADWYAKPENRSRLMQVFAVFEMQAQIMAAQKQLHVLTALLGVIDNAQSKPETVRKACCDVLKMAQQPKIQKGASDPSDAGQGPDLQQSSIDQAQSQRSSAELATSKSGGEPKGKAEPNAANGLTVKSAAPPKTGAAAADSNRMINRG